MKSFNLSDWALGHRSLVWYFMIAFMAAGLFAYLQLGRQEDPDFTIKTMVIGAQWPGASPEEMTRQVTDRIEKKLEELESLDYTKSVNHNFWWRHDTKTHHWRSITLKASAPRMKTDQIRGPASLA